MTRLAANNVKCLGPDDATPMVFVHGMGCEQGMWQHVAPAFTSSHRVVLYDHTGLGRSDRSAYDPDDYATLEPYARDLLAICSELEVTGAVLVGHSVGAIIGAMAASRAPDRFSRLVLLNPSPRYVDDPSTGYRGGFTNEEIDELLGTLASNYLGWLDAAAPMIMQAPIDAPATTEFIEHMCGSEPSIVRRFAEVTFRGDYRAELPLVKTPALVLQSRHNLVAPASVGRWVADTLDDGEFQLIDTSGNCPQLSAPLATIDAIRSFL